MSVDFTLHRKQTGDGSQIAFEVSAAIHNDLWAYIVEVGAKTNDHFRVRIDRPFRPRRTGYRSGSARLHGHCADLAEQLTDEKKGIIYTADQVKQAMKRMAASEGGWPTTLDVLDGTEQPMSEADASMEQEVFINRVLQRYADIHGFWLHEYDETVDPPVPYRSVGGRSRKEMETYWKERGL